MGFGLLCFTSFFSLLNPFGVMPIFMSMTANLDEQNRKLTAKKAIIVTFITLLAFAFGGQLLFKLFGITVHSFRMAGGIIFFIMGFEMLQARLSSIKISTEYEKKTFVDDVSVTPLAIPMLAGPGTITTSIVLMDDADTPELKAILIAIILLICIITYISFILSNAITKWFGETGMNVMMRLMGLILMVIAIEFFFKGLGPIIQKMMQTM